MLLDDPFLAILQLFHNVGYFFIRKRGWVFSSQEIDNSRRILDISPSLFAKVHFDQDVTRPHPLFTDLLLASLHFGNVSLGIRISEISSATPFAC